jgi:hypothetical protein
MLTILGGRGAGKTFMLVQTARAAAERGSDVVIVVPSTERADWLRREYPGELRDVDVVTAGMRHRLRERACRLYVDDWQMLKEQEREELARDGVSARVLEDGYF